MIVWSLHCFRCLSNFVSVEYISSNYEMRYSKCPISNNLVKFWINYCLFSYTKSFISTTSYTEIIILSLFYCKKQSYLFLRLSEPLHYPKHWIFRSEPRKYILLFMIYNIPLFPAITGKIQYFFKKFLSMSIYISYGKINLCCLNSTSFEFYNIALYSSLLIGKGD